MSDYISRDAAVEIAMRYCPDDDGSCSEAGADLREMLDELEAIPAADVREIRRGKWIESKREPVHNSNWERVYWKCSECGIEILTTLPEYEIQKWCYCVNCGAKMEEQT